MKRKNEWTPLSKEEKKKAVDMLSDYLEEEFDVTPGNLQTEILLDYITSHIGIYYYNKGLCDAASFMTEKADDLYLLLKEEDESRG